uniref:RING-type E3 ubiquitin transferase n=1 Tax=Leersia perrieri TaxID=77586 RepID=A0A0D9WMB8_9ORYZ
MVIILIAGGGGGGGARISPAVVFVLVILVVVLFVSGLLHLLVRFLLRRGRARAAAAAAAEEEEERVDESALQRQLQQLFHLHDSGLDQDVIDALPVFVYRELVVGVGGGAGKEPFDCAVCLCEFAGDDRLRLLPTCGHAFHIGCIDTWLLSNSTCPLCRADAAALLLDAAFDDVAAAGGIGGGECDDAVFPVRLGKFKNIPMAAGPVRDGNAGDGAAIVAREEGESSSSSLDGRRCFSMGSYQYVLAEASLQVSLHRRHGDAGAATRMRGLAVAGAGGNTAGGGGEGKKIGAGSKGDSFSVSKIWQWPRQGKGKLPVLASDDSPAVDGRLPWPERRSPG